MNTVFSTSLSLFAAAVDFPSSASDLAIIEDAANQESEIRHPQEWYDTIIAAHLRNEMRLGCKQIRISDFGHLNGAEMEVLAQRLREAGFDAVANPELPLWARIILIQPIPHIRIRWNPAELAARLSARNHD